MADIRAEDLTQETKSTLDGSEQFIMFDSTEGKRGTVSDVGDYILQNGDASGQGDTVADMIADVPTGDTVSFTQTQTSGDELGTITINGTGKKIYGKSYANKQDKLVSGTNIKTINGDSLLGSGNIVIQGGGGGDTVTYTQTVSSGTKLGDININGTPNTVYAPTIPTTVSSFTNDAGYLTSYTETDPVFTASAAHSITSSDISAWNAKQSAITSTTTTISVANWNATTTCTKSVTGVTSSNSVIVTPAPASISTWTSNGVYCSAQGSGTLTFTCSTTPSADITVNIMIVG